MAGLLSDILGFVDRAKQSTRANVGLLMDNPQEYARQINESARDINRQDTLAVQGKNAMLAGRQPTPEQMAAMAAMRQRAENLSMGFAGTVTPGLSWLGKKLPSVEKLAKSENKFLYHSDTAKNVENLKYGIDPQQGGSWIKEIAEGSGANVDDLLSTQTPMSWFSDKPSWVKIKVARELNKPLDKVTTEDIKKHGHLAIVNKKDPYLQDIWRVGEQGLLEGQYSKVTDIKGQQVPAYQTGMYQEGNYGQRLEPFGVEKNEWVSTQSVEPFIQLTGDNLVKFLKLTGNLK